MYVRVGRFHVNWEIFVKTFTRYLDAARFCREHNLSLAAIQRTGHWKFTVFVDGLFTVGMDGSKPLPSI